MVEAKGEAVITDNGLRTIIRLRLATGLLGEQAQVKWWPSLWGTSSGEAFLVPIGSVAQIS